MAESRDKKPYAEEYAINPGDFSAIGEASTKFKATLAMLGVPSDVVRRASIVAYEAEMNVLIHGGGGKIQLAVYPDSIELKASDKGPGIPDVQKAMQEGFSTATDDIRELGFGAGMGLPNIKRNSDAMNLETEVGKGTVLTATINFAR